MNPISKIALNFSANARRKRAELFRSYFSITKETRILDLGSENGTNIHNYLQGTDFDSKNIHIADIDANAIERGHELYGFTPVLADETGKLPFEDKYFDIVYCSSVIEHTTLKKSEVWKVRNSRVFRIASWERQHEFAKEIIRLGRQYFVQTPSKTFPIESHTWLPLVGYLPREAFVPLLRLSNRFWVKKADPDFNLLGTDEMKTLFPDAYILNETKYGLVKSIMAIKTDSPT